MQIRLNNSLTKNVEPFSPLTGNEVRIYSCGPTVYNYAHIGNMRAFLFADLLQRVLRVVGGYDVKWVMNITDIDDKTIRDSAIGAATWLPQMGKQSNDLMLNLRKFTEYYTNAFFDDISKLGIKISHFFDIPRATEYIEQMQELIRKIKQRGYAYISDGSVYFDVLKYRADHQYGKLYNIDFENFRKGERIDADQYEKEQANDFALWKAKKSGEPYWAFDLDGNVYDGRPGWHLECSTMEYEILGLPFDIHTGGVDLKFPHHEDEIAQSKAGYGIEPTIFWCHNEFLEVEGEKMSKSLGNYFTLRDLLDKGLDPLDIRFAMLSAHYGSKFNFTFDGIEAAHKARNRVQNYIFNLFDEAYGTNNANIDDLRKRIFSELADDLHTPKALATLFTFINNNEPHTLENTAKTQMLTLLSQLNEIFDVWEIGVRKTTEINIPEDVKDLAERRLKARQMKNFKEADILRDKILNLGYEIKDTKDGYELSKRLFTK